ILQYTLQFAVLCNERLCCFFPVLFVCLFNVPHRSGVRVRRDLGGVCQDMWAAAGNNMVVGTDLAVDTSATATQLFSLTPPGITKLSQPVYTKFKALLDNYIADETKPEESDANKVNEEDDFINTIAVPGGPMHFAFQYLNASGKTTAVDLDAFKPILKTMWFTKYPKGGGVPTYSGFEHTFVGKTRKDYCNIKCTCCCLSISLPSPSFLGIGRDGFSTLLSLLFIYLFKRCYFSAFVLYPSIHKVQ
ncbi:hypothetical protein pdam_00002958, partial [Pocillopora damicornis]